MARELFPDAFEGRWPAIDPEVRLSETWQAVCPRRPLLSATFTHATASIHTDLLVPVDSDAWDIVTVASTTEPKDVDYQDLAFQRYVCERNGLRIRSTSLLHVDREFARDGLIEAGKFLKSADLTDNVLALTPDVAPKLQALAALLSNPHPPASRIGPQCNGPFECPLRDKCWACLPEDHVLTLCRGRTKAFGLLGQGILKISQVPEEVKLSRRQQIQKATVLSDRPHVNRHGLSSFLAKLVYPLFFLDFETIAPAIPLFDGTHPYEQIPFQYSLHILHAPGDLPQHHEFLADGTVDPRPELIARLQALLKNDGSIVSYNAAFERTILKQCCAGDSMLTSWFAEIEKRFLDLLSPFRSFDYYHPDQHGSTSMKVVLPALTGVSYDNLPIRDGTTASLQYLRVTYGGVASEERARVRRQLPQYCGQDTLGMIQILDGLSQLC